MGASACTARRFCCTCWPTSPHQCGSSCPKGSRAPPGSSARTRPRAVFCTLRGRRGEPRRCWRDRLVICNICAMRRGRRHRPRVGKDLPWTRARRKGAGADGRGPASRRAPLLALRIRISLNAAQLDSSRVLAWIVVSTKAHPSSSRTGLRSIIPTPTRFAKTTQSGPFDAASGQAGRDRRRRSLCSLLHHPLACLRDLGSSCAVPATAKLCCTAAPENTFSPGKSDCISRCLCALLCLSLARRAGRSVPGEGLAEGLGLLS